MSNSVLHLALSHSPLLLQASQSNHGVPRLLQFLLALCMALHSVAQNDTTANRAPPPVDPYPYGQKFNPSMAIIMVVLVSAFFLLGFFSVYLRQCADGRYRGGPDRDRDPSAPYGFGRLSRAARGLDASVIDTFPTFLYSSVKGLKIGKGSLECAVCLNEFDDNETLRLIPKCSHVFHPDCIDAWLCSHTTCPVCRADLVPKPGEDDHPPSVHLPDSGPRPDYIDPVEQVQDHLAGGAEPGAAGSRPIRTRSTGMRLGRLFVFPRSHSTGHSLSLVRPGDDHERFTLRLPEEVWSQMISDARLNRANSCVPFPRASSLRTGYRSRRGGSGRFGARGQSPFFYERFDRDSPSNRWVLSKSPPFILRAGSARVGKGVVDGGGGEVGRSPTMGLEKPSKPPQFDRWDLEVGERSSDKLRPGYSQV